MQVGNEIRGAFNYNITLLTGTIKVYKDNVLFLTFTEADITVFLNDFSVDVTGLLTDASVYTVELSAGLFDSVVGLNPLITWEFTLSAGEFEGTEFESTEFLTT